MAPTAITTLTHHARGLASEAVSSLGPLAVRSILRRDDDDDDSDNDSDDDETDPTSGVTDFHDINNTAIFVIFGLIGAAFVCTGIWFFFWAKNGGFYFKDNDWEEYKSTVLRRKGPNGTLLSGATPTTDLGGGSVYKDYDHYRGSRGDNGDNDDDGHTVVTESTGLSGITAGASDIGAREKRERKRQKKEKERQKKRRSEKEKEKTKDRSRSRAGLRGHHVDEHGNLIDEYAEREAKENLRNYRHEKPARVGGLNKESEASEWDGSTNPGDSTVSSNLLSNRESTPTNSPRPKSGGIRKVYSTADRNADRDGGNAHLRDEARKLAERGRSVANSSGSPQRTSRRDFSYQVAGSTISESDVGLQRGVGGSVPGSWADSDAGTGSDLGHKTYKHSRYLPGTDNGSGTGASSSYAEEKRKNRRQGGGYRRER